MKLWQNDLNDFHGENYTQKATGEKLVFPKFTEISSLKTEWSCITLEDVECMNHLLYKLKLRNPTGKPRHRTLYISLTDFSLHLFALRTKNVTSLGLSKINCIIFYRPYWRRYFNCCLCKNTIPHTFSRNISKSIWIWFYNLMQ